MPQGDTAALPEIATSSGETRRDFGHISTSLRRGPWSALFCSVTNPPPFCLAALLVAHVTTPGGHKVTQGSGDALWSTLSYGL